MGHPEQLQDGGAPQTLQASLKVPETGTKAGTHLRTDSATSRSYSFLDIYQADSPDSGSVKGAPVEAVDVSQLEDLGPYLIGRSHRFRV